MNTKTVATLLTIFCLIFTLGIVGDSFAACSKGTEKECKSAVRGPKNSCSDIEDAVEEMHEAMNDGDIAKAKEYAQQILDEYNDFQDKFAKANAKIDKAESTANDTKAAKVAQRYKKRMAEYSESAEKAKVEAENLLAQQ